MNHRSQVPPSIAAPEVRARALSFVGWSSFLIFESGRPRQSIDPQGRTCFRGTVPPIFALGLFSVAALFSFSGWYFVITLSVLHTSPRSPWDWLFFAITAAVSLASGWLGVYCILWRRRLIVDTRCPGGPMVVLHQRSGIRVTETSAPLHLCIAIRTRVTVQTRSGRGRSVPTLQVLVPNARPFLIWHGKDCTIEAAGARWTELTGQAIAAA